MLLGALVLVTLATTQRSRAAAHATSASWARLVGTQDLRRLMSDAADDYTTYFATGEERFARRSRDRIDTLRSRLSTLSSEAVETETRNLCARAAERTEAWITEYVEPSFALRARYADGKASAEMLRLTIAGDASADYRRDIEAMLDSIEEQERKQLAALEVAEELADRRLQQILLFGAAAALALGLGVAGLFIRQIGVRLERLRELAARVGRGELGHKLEPDSADSIGALTQAFNEMSGALLFAREAQQRGEAIERRSRADAAVREQVLRESEERFRVAFQAGHDALCVVRLEDGVWVAANQRFTGITGWTEGEVVGRTGEQIGLWVDAEFRARMSEALQQRGEFRDGETRFRTKSGALIDCTVSGQVMMIAGKPHLFAATRDITASKRLQEQFLHAQKMEAVGRLASGVAHDFNNLLVAVLGGCDFLLEGRPSDEVLREEAQQIREAGKRAAELVRQLMAFSRKSALRPVGCDLNERIRGIEKLLRRSIGEHIELDLALSPEPLVVTLDPSHFDQILMNLAVNARDAMSGGGRLRLATRPRNVQPVSGGDRWVELAVEDTGSA
jgi:PAS domain S-box-containing protein